jgi:hypothetical protein
LSPSSQSVPSSSLHWPLQFPSSSLPFHDIIISLIHWIGCTALLRTCHGHFWWDALPFCSDWLNNTFRVLAYKLTWTNEDTQFSPQMELGVLQILNMCILDFFCCVCGLNSLSSWLAAFMVFNLWIGPGSIFESCS